MYSYALTGTLITETASSFLNDTSILNPKFVYLPSQSTVYLKVEASDSSSIRCIDSVKFLIQAFLS